MNSRILAPTLFFVMAIMVAANITLYRLVNYDRGLNKGTHADKPVPRHTQEAPPPSPVLEVLPPFSPGETGNPKKHAAVVKLYDIEHGKFFCSGTVISKNYILTAGHCLRDYERFAITIEVKTMLDKPTGIKAAAVYAAGRSDQGLLIGDFSAFNSMPIEVRTAEELSIYQDQSRPVIACGFPYGGEYFCSAFTNRHQEAFSIGGDGFLYPGMSGGPVIDLKSGVIIGINTAVVERGIIISPILELLNNAEIPVE